MNDYPTAMDLDCIEGQLIWQLVDSSTAEFRQVTATEVRDAHAAKWAVLHEEVCNSVHKTAKYHETNVRYNVCCGVVTSYAWLTQHDCLESAWAVDGEPEGDADSPDHEVKAAGIKKIMNFHGKSTKTVFSSTLAVAACSELRARHRHVILSEPACIYHMSNDTRSRACIYLGYLGYCTPGTHAVHDKAQCRLP